MMDELKNILNDDKSGKSTTFVVIVLFFAIYGSFSFLYENQEKIKTDMKNAHEIITKKIHEIDKKQAVLESKIK